MERHHNGHYAIIIKIEGKHEAKCLIDTGSTDQVLSERFVKASKIKTHKLPKDESPPSMSSQTDYVKVALGEFDKITSRFYVAKTIPIVDKDKRPLDGILGSSGMLYWTWHFEWQKKTVILMYPGKLSNEELRGIQVDPKDSIPLKMVDESGRSFVPATFGEKSCEMLIDTGAVTTTLFNRNFINSLMLEATGKQETFGFDFMGIERAMFHLAYAPRFQLGNTTFERIPVHYPVDPKLKLDDEAETHPILGVGILDQSDLLIDFPAQKMYLGKPASK